MRQQKQFDGGLVRCYYYRNRVVRKGYGREMDSMELVGYLAGITVAVSLTPQVVKAWRTRSTGDISILWTVIYLLGLILWIVYGVGIASYPIVVMLSIEALLALALLALKLKYG